jgi:predicted nucleotidyltransferase
MNVMGYEEALAGALDVVLGGDRAIRVASLPGLTLLKLLAWADRGGQNSKDALDLMVILSNYGVRVESDRLWNEELPLLQQVGYDLDHAGARLLGADVRALARHSTQARLLAVLENADGRQRLANDMSRVRLREEGALEQAEVLLHEFERGLSSPPR